MLLIINADDLGKSKKINNAIFDLMSKQLISSATIMANGPAVKDAAIRLTDFKFCSFGIHLNLTEFQPLSKNRSLKTIIDKSGNFGGLENLKGLNIYSPSIINAIYEELCSQFDKILSLNIDISHIDSHEHIYTMPKLFPVLKRLQKKYRIKKVRLSRNIFSQNDTVPVTLRLKKKVFNFLLRHCYSTKTTEGFCNLTQFIENINTIHLKYKSVEIMVHPGLQSSQKESYLLNRFWSKKIPFECQVINYYQL